jgi:hypothetical protein
MKKTILFLASCMMTIISFAQITTSSISGVVVNYKKEVMVGASVVATHVPTGTTYKTVTNKTGAYVFPAVRVGGPFTVATNYVGFKKVEETDINTQLGVTTNVNFILINENSTLKGKDWCFTTIFAQRVTISSNYRSKNYRWYYKIQSIW